VSENGQRGAPRRASYRFVTLDADTCYRALTARDPRFDGLFFVAVKTTGVYCRPVCRARTPRRERCAFYRTAAEADRDGFRACLRCRPELAPGHARVDAESRTVARAVARIESGALNSASVDDLARELGVTARHLRRSMQSEIGVSPLDLAQSCRVALAKQLLQDSTLPMTEVAFAGGFQSVRRFNDAFRARYGRPPSALRGARRKAESQPDVLELTLEYRAPYDWACMLAFLAARATPGVELAADGAYLRTVEQDGARGFVRVTRIPGRDALRAQVSLSLARVLMPLVARLRRTFDLDAQPELIAAHLKKDAALRGSVRVHAGLRLPGAFDGFETALRAVLGQQVSVGAATTLAGRVAQAFGEPIETPHPKLSHLAPDPARVAAASEQAIAALGVMPARARTLRALAQAVLDGAFAFDARPDPESTLRALEAVPGIGPWTAQYVAMRVLADPDAFPASDLGVRKALGGVSHVQVLARAERWRPWRAYAAMHLWTQLGRSEHD
jgi:AraC family transcriptional regulator of adaptative response / DNA-3-methyladenine glycosylase II